MRIRNQIIVPLVACALGLAPAVATAKPHHTPVCRPGYKHPMVKKRVHRYGQWIVVRNRGKIVYVRGGKCVKWKPTIAARSMVVGTGGHINGNCTQPATGNIVRTIVFVSGASTYLPCAKNAVATGHKLLLGIQYYPGWTITQDRAWFRKVLKLFSPLHPYAISIGNEQELYDTNPADYVAVWRAVEPMVARADPSAIRVAGEIAPWGLPFLTQAAKLGLPGAQIFAGHVYPDHGRGFDPASLTALAQQYGVQAWATEGMCGPDAWKMYGCIPQSTLRADGIALGVNWYVTN